uniref:Sphingomyelin phosphodiesterase C-terminal domain-containing protein n=1 Tax=Plectus sambesii TaxID=2011161 RepID=A0A914XDR3_9BILA
TVLDAETYSTNLTEANSKGTPPVWSLEYNTRQAFGMPDLSPKSWNDLIKRFETDDALFLKYLRYLHREDYTRWLDGPLDADSKKKYICSMRTAKSFEEAHFCGL